MNTSEAGLRIRARRKELGISQQGLSEIAGVSLHTLSNVESGRGNPTMAVLIRILEPLGLELRIGIAGPHP